MREHLSQSSLPAELVSSVPEPAAADGAEVQVNQNMQDYLQGEEYLQCS